MVFLIIILIEWANKQSKLRFASKDTLFMTLFGALNLLSLQFCELLYVKAI